MAPLPRSFKTALATLVVTLAVSATTPARAVHGEPVSADRGTDMAVDLILVRPLGLVATVLGSVGFVLALPFTLPSGSAGDTACEWIVAPLDYTFKRPLGDFDHRTRTPHCGPER